MFLDRSDKSDVSDASDLSEKKISLSPHSHFPAEDDVEASG